MGLDISSLQGSAPSAPASGFSVLYPLQADAKWYYKTAAGNVKTLMTLEDAQNVTGALTLTTPVINTAAHVGGTWVADATWTLPALTLGGAVTGNGQNISGVGTFSATTITSTATSGAAFSAVSATTGTSWLHLANTSADAYVGIEGAAGGAIVTGTTPYALIVGQFADKPTQIVAANALVATFASSAITFAKPVAAFQLSGNVTSTGNPSLNIGSGALTAGAGSFTTLATSGAITYTQVSGGADVTFQTNSDTSNVNVYIKNNAATPGAGRIYFGDSGSATQGQIIYTNSTDVMTLGVGGSTVLTLTSTGLAVTGTLSATSTGDFTGPVRVSHGYTVATLPAGTVGQRAYVTDATAPTFLGALVGGGAVVTPVFYNGSAWVAD